MITPVVSIVFDPQRRCDKNRLGAVNICIYYNRKRKYISTGVMLRKREWSSGIVVRRGDAEALNEKIQSIYHHTLEEVNKQISSQSFCLETITTHIGAYLQEGHASENFIKFCLEILRKSNLAPGTVKQKLSALRSLDEFGRIVSFDDLTPDNIAKYDLFLKSGKRAQITVRTRHKVIHSFVTEAIRLGHITQDPYRGMKIPRGAQKIRRYLTPYEQKKFLSVNPDDPLLKKVKDLFVVQMYTGLAYSDLASVDFSSVEERNGKYVLLDERVKTAEPYYIVLLPPVVRILQKYNYHLPIISNQLYNRRLKDIQRESGIIKRITTHTARHTFAVWALRNGTPIEIVSKMLGHSNIKTTQLYAIVLNKEVENAYERLANCVI